MSYYSEVRYLVAGKEEVMTAMLAAWRLRDEDAAEQLGKVTITPYREGLLLLSFHMDNRKWYDSHPDVPMHKRFLNFTDDYEVEGVFLRMGEDDVDIEHSSYGQSDYGLDQYLYTSRAVHCDINIDPADDIRRAKNGSDALPTIPESEGAIP
jgi:hypothetical protein